MPLKLIQPKHYYLEFKQLLQFVIAPKYQSTQSLSISQKIEKTWTMFVVKFVLAIIFGVAVGLFYDAENKTTVSMAERFSPLILLFVTVFALPLLEEVADRLSLIFKPIYLALTLGALAYYIASKVGFHTKLSDVYDHFFERCIIALSTFMLTYPLFTIPSINRRLKIFWKNNFRWIFYFFSLVFAWSHIMNYELSLEHLLLMPLLTVDKLVSALCYGYVRVNYGFVYSFAIHAFNNSIGFIVGLYSSSN